MKTVMRSLSLCAMLFMLCSFVLPEKVAAQEYYFDRVDGNGAKYQIWYNRSGDAIEMQFNNQGTWYKTKITYSDLYYDYDVEKFTVKQIEGGYTYTLLVDWANEQITLIRPNGSKAAYFLRE